MPYRDALYAGSLAANRLQGSVIVTRFNQDPCAAGGSGDFMKAYDTPYLDGALTLTGISGDTVTFTTSGERAGAFAFMSGQFG